LKRANVECSVGAIPKNKQLKMCTITKNYFLKIVRLTKVCIRDNVLTKMLECYR